MNCTISNITLYGDIIVTSILQRRKLKHRHGNKLANTIFSIVSIYPKELGRHEEGRQVFPKLMGNQESHIQNLGRDLQRLSTPNSFIAFPSKI